MSEVKTYSLAEIKAHNTNKSTWIVIHNNIYDVTEFLNEVGTFTSEAEANHFTLHTRQGEWSVCEPYLTWNFHVLSSGVWGN